LALGIGANVVVFGVRNATSSPLDVPEPTGLYNVVHDGQGYDNQSYPDHVDFKNRNSTFSDLIEPASFARNDMDCRPMDSGQNMQAELLRGEHAWKSPATH
jgi:hypothetical protein